MNACVLHAPGDLRTEHVPTPEPKAGEVLVRVRACGVCGSDIPRIFTKGTYTFPTIPGHEFAGDIAAAGEGVDPAWEGRRVAVYPLIPCKKCSACAAGHYFLCRDYDYIGSRRDGAFADFVTAPVWNLMTLSDGLSFEEGALMEPTAVALHAVKRAPAVRGHTVAIFGAGPIGLLVAFWARFYEAREILVFDIDEERLRFAQSLGFDSTHNPTDGASVDFVQSRTEDGADLTVDAAGVNAALSDALESTRPMGTLVLLGNPAGSVSLTQDTYWTVLRKQLNLVGSWNSAYDGTDTDDWHTSMAAISEGAMPVASLLTHRVNLNNLHDALTVMRERSEFSAKVMLSDEA